MSFRRGLGLIIAAVLLVGIGSMVTQNAYRSGWQQGYLTAKVDSLDAATAEETQSVAPPAAPSRMGPRGMAYSDGFGMGHGRGGFSLFGFLAVFLLGLLLLKFIFGARHWRHWHGRSHKRHPWVDEDEPVQKA